MLGVYRKSLGQNVASLGLCDVRGLDEHSIIMVLDAYYGYIVLRTSRMYLR